MANEYTNKVVANNTTLIDLTSDTATAADVLEGRTLHLASGAPASGTYRPSDEIEARLKATVGHSAKNWIDLNKYYYSTGISNLMIAENTGALSFTGTGTNRGVNFIAADLGVEMYGKTYIISCVNNLASTTSGRIALRKRGTNQIVKSVALNTIGAKSMTFTPDAETFPDGWFISVLATGSTSTTANIDISQLMLRDGNISDDTFEPYVTPTDERVIQAKNESINETIARLKATVGHSAKNKLDCSSFSNVDTNNVVMTLNGDNATITVYTTDTPTAQTTVNIDFTVAETGNYYLSGIPSTTPNDSLYLFCWDVTNNRRARAWDKTSASALVTVSNPTSEIYLEAGVSYQLSIRVQSAYGKHEEPVIVSPMLRDGSISDDTFEPYITPTDERIVQLRQDMATALAAKLDKPVVLWEGTAYNTTLVTLPVTDIRNDYDRLILQFETSTSGSYPTVYFFEAIVNTDFNNTFPSHERTFPATYGSVLLSMSIQYGSANSLIFNYAELIGTVSSYNVKLTKIIGIPK